MCPSPSGWKSGGKRSSLVWASPWILFIKNEIFHVRSKGMRIVQFCFPTKSEMLQFSLSPTLPIRLLPIKSTNSIDFSGNIKMFFKTKESIKNFEQTGAHDSWRQQQNETNELQKSHRLWELWDLLWSNSI
jgi:hypothetical protein